MPVYLWVHIVLLSVMILCELIAVTVAMRKKRNWYKQHRLYATVGAVSGTIGILVLFVAKQIGGGGHFYPVHAKVGLFAALLMIALVAVGMNLAKLPSGVRTVHKISGKIAIVLLVVSMITGFLLITG